MSVSPFTAAIPTDAEVVDISSTDHEFISSSNCFGIWVGVAGVVIAVLRDKPTVNVTYTGAGAGTIIPGRFLKVIRTGTTATDMLGMIVNTGSRQ